MPKLLITVDLVDTPWYNFRPSQQGVVHAIGVLPDGMTSGKPSVSFDIVMTDGTHSFAEMSLRQFQVAAAAFEARWGDVAAQDEVFIADIPNEENKQ